ncbi:MAG TPA: hypothetical protein VD969_27705 [Symbiobacteriaceae bacterium]|nr:hypothetical protein [Symbiobacteriaceae bacterium]
MKDPLQTEQTPYEILGVERSADRAHIERAFATALGRRIPPNVAKNARDALLLHPAKRAWYDLLLYDDAALAQLTPPPLGDGGVLGRERRAATAQAWEQQLRRRFPDPGLVHSLAVFWYWWALFEEERLQTLIKALGGKPATGAVPGKSFRQAVLKAIRKAEGVTCNPDQGAACTKADCPWRQDCLSSAPPPKEMWERVIGYWAMLTTGADFAHYAPELDNHDREALRQQLTNSLRNTLIDLAGQYDSLLGPSASSAAGRGGQSWSDQYRTLESTLTAELESAQALLEVGMRTSVGRVACGALVLTQMGLLDAARTKVEAALKSKPDSRTLQKLRDMLMPHSAVAVLVAQRKPEAALAAIRELSPEQQKSGEVLSLRAQAYQLLARQKAAMDRIKEALADWKTALADAVKAGKTALAAEIRSEVSSTCHAKAAAMGDHHRDEAIRILEQARNLVQDERLTLSLAALLLRRGITTFVHAQEELERHRELTDAIMEAFSRGRIDLERARDLGSREATEQAGLARNFMIDALLARGISKINEAQEQAKNRGAITDATITAMESGLHDLEQAEELGSTKAAEQAQVARELLVQVRFIRAGGGNLVRRQAAPAKASGSGCGSVLAAAVLLVTLVVAVCTIL